MSLGCNLNEVKQNAFTGIQNLVKTNTISMDKNGIISFDYSKSGKYKTREAAFNVAKSVEKKIKKWLSEQVGPKFTENWTETIQNNNAVFLQVRFPKYVESAYIRKFSNQQQSATSYEPILDLFEEPLFEATDVVTPSYDKYIQYKKNLIYRAENRLNQINRAKKENSNDTGMVKELITLENQIKERLEGHPEEGIKGLRDELAELEENPPIDKFLYYADLDLKRLDTLSNSVNEQDLKEAETIIRFYDKVGTFSTKEDNPIFSQSDMFNNEGELVLPKDIQNKLGELRDKVNQYGSKIYQRERKAIENTVNNLSKVGLTFGEKKFTYDELFMKEEGLKDIPWVDMFLMDITNGIMSSNGMVPQAIMNIVQNSFETNLVYAKSIEHKMNTLQPDVERELKKLGYGISIPGVKGVSYELFRTKNTEGQYRDSIVQRYSELYLEKRNRMLSDLEDKLSEARAQEDPVKKSNAFTEAFDFRDNWYKKNTIVIDVRKISDFNNSFGSISIDDNGTHEAELKTLLGEKGYQEEIKKQAKLLKDFETAYEVYRDKLLADEGTSELSEAGKNKLETWEKRNNPFTQAESYYTNTPIMKGKLKLNSSMAYNYSIPRKNIASLTLTKGGLEIIETTNETNYYDTNFETIESNPVLKDFHNLLMEVNQKIFDIMPPDIKDKFNAHSLPQLQKNITEILFDPNTSFLQRVSKAAREIYERIMGMFGIKVQNNYSYANVDPITGLPEYQVNAEFLQSNKEEIQKRYDVESLRLKIALGYSPTEKLGKYASFKWHRITPEAWAILEENIDPRVIQRIKDNPTGQTEIFTELRNGITHQVVQEQSFDLPKMIKLFSYLGMEYQARQEVMPLVEMMKKHYEQIKNPVLTNTGNSVVNAASDDTRLDGERKNAIRQMNSWFERVVLGDYGSKNEFGDSQIVRKGKLGLTGNQKIDAMTGILQTTVTGRILTKEEKLVEEKLNSIISEIQNRIDETTNQEEVKKLTNLQNKLINQLNNLGKKFTWTKALDAIFNFIRFKGLGWNLSSQTTNFLEGQIGNFISAASGQYFTPENIYEANQIVQGSFLKNTSFGYVQTDNAKKVRLLMDRYRILQDSSNELQKASSKSAFSSFSNLSPFELMKRVEYLNQSPLMIASLMDIEIKGKDGSKSNVWKEMQVDGTLSDNFRTEENINNWEEANGKGFNDFSSHIRKVIVNTHGDYDELRGNMASEYISGKALLMFKRWLSRAIYTRFGVEQTDLETGLQDFKGRYRSHTTATAAIHGALIGFGGLGILGAGPLGIVIGASAGVLAGKFYGANSGLGFLQESAFIGKELAMNLLRMPVNSLTGKQIIKSADYKNLNLSKQDLRNYKANLTDMSLTLGFIALLLFTKAMLWDDEDDAESQRRKMHNYFANKFMQLSSQASMYLNPVELYTNSIGNLPVIKFFTDVQETSKAAQKYLDGDDTITSGSNAGESNLYNKASKAFLPGLFKAEVGFEGQMQKQFKPSPFDKWFQSEEKEAKEEVKEKKVQTKTKYLTDDLTPEETKEITKIINKIFKKDKGESYQDVFNEISTETFDEELEAKLPEE